MLSNGLLQSGPRRRQLPGEVLRSAEIAQNPLAELGAVNIGRVRLRGTLKVMRSATGFCVFFASSSSLDSCCPIAGVANAPRRRMISGTKGARAFIQIMFSPVPGTRIEYQ